MSQIDRRYMSALRYISMLFVHINIVIVPISPLFICLQSSISVFSEHSKEAETAGAVVVEENDADAAEEEEDEVEEEVVVVVVDEAEGEGEEEAVWEHLQSIPTDPK